MDAPPFVILYSQAIRRDPENGMDDHLAILEARATTLWARYCTRELEESLHGDAWTLRQDLKLWEQNAATMREPLSLGSPGTCRVDSQELQTCRMPQDQWRKIRLQTCHVVSSRIGAAICGRQWHKGDPLFERPAQQKEDISRMLTNDIFTSAKSALQIIVAARLADGPTTSALRLARPFYIIATALIDESKRIGSRDRTLTDLLRSEIACALEMLQDLGHTIGDQYSVEILETMQLRRCETSG